MTKDSQLQRHHKRWHRYDQDETVTPVENEAIFPDLEDGAMETSQSLVPVKFNHMNEISQKFFQTDHHSGNAKHHLVSQIYFDGEVSPEELVSSECELGLEIMLLTSSLSTKNRNLLSSILCLFDEVMKSRMELQNELSQGNAITKTNHYSHLNFSKIGETLREMVFRRKNSFMESIPIPSVTQIGEYSYVSVVDVVADFMAHKYEYEEIQDHTELLRASISSIGESPLAREVRNRAMNRRGIHAPASELDLVTLFLIEWSDGFEPNTAKTNRGSVWAKTISISPRKDAASLQNTYPLSFGPAKGNKDLISRKYQQELQSLKEGDFHVMYNGRTKQMCHVHVELIASVQDQPERRGATSILGGNSLCTARFGYLANLKELVNVLTPCEDCESILLGNDNSRRLPVQMLGNNLNRCTDCAAWSFDEPKRRLLRTKPPKGYPRSELPSHGKLEIAECTFDKMKRAIESAHRGITEDHWNIGTAHSYLASMGLDKDCQTKVIDNAHCCLAEMNCTEEHLREAISRDKETNPESYSMHSGNPSWNLGIEVWQHVEAIMHLLFHGIQKNLMRGIEKWAALSGSQAALQRFGEGTLDAVHALNLEWCKVLPYNGDGFGGWWARRIT